MLRAMTYRPYPNAARTLKALLRRSPSRAYRPGTYVLSTRRPVVGGSS